MFILSYFVHGVLKVMGGFDEAESRGLKKTVEEPFSFTAMTFSVPLVMTDWRQLCKMMNYYDAAGTFPRMESSRNLSLLFSSLHSFFIMQRPLNVHFHIYP